MTDTLIWDVESQAGSSTWLGYSTAQTRTYRQYVLNGSITGNATRIKVRFHAHPTQASPISMAYIGPKKAASDPYDYADVGAITQLTFNTGSDSVTISAGSTADSDEVDYTIDQDTDYIIAVFINTSDYHGYVDSGGPTMHARLSGGGDDTATRNTSGYVEAQYGGPPYQIYAVTSAQNLTVQGSSHAHSAAGAIITYLAQLVASGSSHGHSAESVVSTILAALNVAGSTHAHTADSPVLVIPTAIQVLDIAGGTHSHSAASVGLTATNVLVVSDGTHAHIVDTVTNTIVAQLVVGGSLHSLTSDSPTLTTGTWVKVLISGVDVMSGKPVNIVGQYQVRT